MIVLIDNYDSFTYNLVQYIGGLGYECDVVRNDQKSADDVLAQAPSHIVISPGPSDPEHAGICLELIKKCEETSVPLFGVCLGHQSIGQAFGGRVIRAPEPMHGKISQIFHENKSVFKGIPSPFSVTRYHSLIVERDTLPSCLEVTAWTNDGLIMGLQHTNKPIHGVQFHPESIATENGLDLLRNFFTMA
ncbi:MAG: aminodeoxychorismate/anthranilate synthase component II [Pseudobdellovibrionaceae bacterium]|jgi:anthranilate synthase component 2|nr:aminodeoxychorismate/anthranilate synthase component II [Pseudobdellovibrionaceae bacterium]